MMNNIYKKLSLSALCKRLLEYENPLFLMHTRPDGDTVGSAAAMILLFRALGKNAGCICNDKIPDRLSFLLYGVADCLNAETYKPHKNDAIISIDIGAAGQIGGIIQQIKKVDLSIDHHSKGEPFADCYIDTSAAAAGQIVFDIVREFLKSGKIASLESKMAERIYAAISSDTSCFKYSNVTVKTHKTAAELLKTGIPHSEINHHLFGSKSIELLNAERIALENLTLHNNGSVAICTVSNYDKAKNNLQDEHFETAIEIARCVKGVLIGIAIKEIDGYDGSFRVSMRANGDTNVAEICAHFGGGGHLRAAGCTIERANIKEAEDAILAQLKNIK